MTLNLANYSNLKLILQCAPPPPPHPHLVQVNSQTRKVSQLISERWTCLLKQQPSITIDRLPSVFRFRKYISISIYLYKFI
jgi:hypothetical protein